MSYVTFDHWPNKVAYVIYRGRIERVTACHELGDGFRLYGPGGAWDVEGPRPSFFETYRLARTFCEAGLVPSPQRHAPGSVATPGSKQTKEAETRAPGASGGTE